MKYSVEILKYLTNHYYSIKQGKYGYDFILFLDEPWMYKDI